MMKRQIVLILLIFFSFQKGIFAQDVVSYYYQVEKYVQGDTSILILTPRKINLFEKNKGAFALSLFERLKSEKKTEYGSATLQIGEVEENALLNLDESKKEYWNIVIGEVYWTLRSAGFISIKAPKFSPEPLKPDSSSIAVFLLQVPYYYALPPSKYYNAVIRLSPSYYLLSEIFYNRLQKNDRELLETILKGLSDKDERVRLAILSSIPYLGLKDINPYILSLLKDPIRGIRLSVLKLLEKGKDKTISEKLKEVVESDPDPDIKLGAAKILVSMGEKEYEIYIHIDKLHSSDDKEVINAIETLAESGKSNVSSSLLPLLYHRTPQVRQKALNGIIRLNSYDVMERAFEDERISPEIKDIFARAMSESSTPAVVDKGLVYLINKGSEEGAIYAIEKVSALKLTSLINAVYTAIGRNEEGVRIKAIEALGEIKDLTSIEPLSKAGRSQKEKGIIENTLMKIFSSQNLDTVLHYGSHKDTFIRKCAIKSIAEFIKNEKQIPPVILTFLESKLQDREIEIKRAAVFSLARVKDERIAKKLSELSKDSDSQIREQVAVSITNSPSPDGNKILIEMLSDESDRVRLKAIIGIREKGIKEALETLLQMGKYRNVEIRREVIKTVVSFITEVEAEKYFDFFSDAIFDEDKDIRLVAIDGIRLVKGPKTISALSSLVIAKEKEIKIKALQTLSETKDPDAMEHIARGLFDEDKEVKLKAIEGLGFLGAKAGIDPLAEFISNEKDSEIKSYAQKVLQELLMK